MSRQVTTAQLWESIRTSGLATADECRRWAKGVTDGLGKSVAADAEQLIAALVKFGYLTPYQGNSLLRDPTLPLVLEGIRIEKSLENVLGVHWYEGRRAFSTNASERAGSGDRVWIAAISVTTLVAPAVQAWPPSVTWAEHHSRIDSPHLDRWRGVGATLQHLFAIAEPWTAKSLAVELQNGPMQMERALRMVQDIASGLQTLHQTGLVHGHLRLESILVESQETFRLRRDPFFPPRSPYHGTVPSLIPSTHSLLALAPPELALPDAFPSVRSDLYALGCIWYRSITGQWPVETPVGSSPVNWASLHARIPIEIPEGLSERQAKCLLHLLAKEPSARFPSAHAFLHALQSRLISPKTTQDAPAQHPAPAELVVREPSAQYTKQPIASPESKNPDVPPSSSTAAKTPPPQRSIAGNTASHPPSKIPASIPVAIESASAEPVGPSAASRPTSVHEKKGVSKRKKGNAQSQRPFWVMPSLVVGSCLLLFGLAFVLRKSSPSVVTIANSPAGTVNKTGAGGANTSSAGSKPPPLLVDPLSERFDIQADNSKFPWAPPTAGPACSTDLLPSGIQGLAYFSSRAWQHQGPIAPIVAWWNSIATVPHDGWWPEISVPLDAIEQVAVAWYPGTPQGDLPYAVRFALKEPRKLSELINTDAWSPQVVDKSRANSGSIWIHTREGNLSAMLCEGLPGSPEAKTRLVTFGSEELLKSIPEIQGNTGRMRRQLESLLQASDREADLTLLVAPSFLFGDGKNILGPESPRILELIRQVIDDKVQGISLRAQWNKDWYIEWRSIGSDLQAANRNAASLKSSIETAAERLESALLTQPADPYWRAIANRFPQMLRATAKWTRAGAEEGQVVVNAYLPQESLSNLLIGSWMAAQREGSPLSSPTSDTKPAPLAKTIEQWLDTRITMRVEQDSLENLLQAIAIELKEVSNSKEEPIPMTINGFAFQKDGITRNQQVRNFEYTDTPVRQVLTALARRANPVTTVQSPNEKDQKVVWVLADDDSTASKKRLELTTRAWTDAQNISLPEEFAIPKN